MQALAEERVPPLCLAEGWDNEFVFNVDIADG
jgi:hypothetical protein